MRVSEFKSNYCFRIQILNVIEHRVTERTSDQDSEYPLLKTNSRVNAPPCTGELNGSMRRDKASERERDGGPDNHRDDERSNIQRDKTRRRAVIDRFTASRVGQPYPAW